VELGEIRLHSDTTYRQGLDQVRPLVVAYLAGVDQITRKRLSEGFSLFDPAEKPVTSEDDLKFRRIWPELCEAGTDVLVIRPADWITL